MNEIRTELLAAKDLLGFTCSEEQIDDFETYYRVLMEWNEKINLTAIKEPKDVAIKHFIDSLLLLKAVDIPEGARLADIGTGAGFPAIPIGIVRKDLHLTLLDSLNKRVNFLKECTSLLHLQSDCIHGRAEEFGHSGLRESQDIVTARAVAKLPVLCEYCLPFVKAGGWFVALKGPEMKEELEMSERAIELLGGELVSLDSYTLPDESGRSLVRIRKVHSTPKDYPRASAKISKKSL